MKYKSKPHTIRAFQFTPEIRDFPDWFTEAIFNQYYEGAI